MQVLEFWLAGSVATAALPEREERDPGEWAVKGKAVEVGSQNKVGLHSL